MPPLAPALFALTMVPRQSWGIKFELKLMRGAEMGTISVPDHDFDFWVAKLLAKVVPLLRPSARSLVSDAAVQCTRSGASLQTGARAGR